MFRYTPNKQIRKELLKERKRGWNRPFSASYEYIYIRSKFPDYMTGVAFGQHWEKTLFYSETKRDQIPVGGILFPVKYFEEELV